MIPLFIGCSSAAAVKPELEWVTRTAPAGIWHKVAYGGGVFVSLQNGSNGGMISSDGITWTATTLSASSSWVGCAYGGGVFAAVSNFAAAMSSPDGINWTTRTIPTCFYNAVCHGAGKFVAVGGYGASTRAATSTDGITWTSQSIFLDRDWKDVAYGAGLFVAVGTNFSGPSTDVVTTSPDGINWTTRSLPVSSQLRGITYSPYGFFAVGDTDCFRSVDGLTWEVESLFPSIAIAYGEDTLVTVGVGGSYYDLINRGDSGLWSSYGIPISQWNSVAYGNGRFVATSISSGGAVATLENL